MTIIIENAQNSGKTTKNINTIAKQIGVDISVFDKKELLMGLDVEQEHNGTMGDDIDVIPDNDLGTVLKIAIAHLREDPKYYTKLNEMETESLRKIKKLIENKTVTTDDFNLFLESLPKSSEERISRHTRIKKRFNIRNLENQVDHKTDRKGNNDPTKTLRGKLSVARQARRNKQHPDKFVEAIEFIKRNSNKSIWECREEASAIQDKTALLALIVRLLDQSDIKLNKDWLSGIKQFAGC